MSLPDHSTRSRRRRGEPALRRVDADPAGPAEPHPDENEGTGEWEDRPSAGNTSPADTIEAGLDRQEEIELVSRIVGGDQDAFGVLLDRYQGRVYRMVRRMWSRDIQLIEDLTQEVFLRVHRGLPAFQGDCALGTWIHRIAVNVCISELRQRKAMKRDRPTISIDRPLRGSDGDDGLYLEPPAEVGDPGDALEREELYERCRRAIDELPELWRVILTLRDLEDRSYEDIAEILDLPIGTVRSRLHRARARVRRKLDEEGAAREGGA